MEQATSFIVQTSTMSMLKSTAVLTHSSRCGSISLNSASSRQRLVVQCLPVKRADINGNCIWGANLAALTAWPFNTSIRCVFAWNTSAHKSSLHHLRNGHMPSETAHDVGEQSLPTKPTAKPAELMHKRLTTIHTNTSGGSSSSHPTRRRTRINFRLHPSKNARR